MSVLLILAVFISLFAVVLIRGAPYLPTMKTQVDTALDLLNLKNGQTLLELGCGDGRVARRAAERGLKVVGYELNPMLVLIARAYTWRYRGRVRIIWADYWRTDWPQADGVFVFLLDRYMQKLDKKIIQQYKNRPIKLVSIAFQIPRKKPRQTENGVHLYRYD